MCIDVDVDVEFLSTIICIGRTHAWKRRNFSGTFYRPLDDWKGPQVTRKIIKKTMT